MTLGKGVQRRAVSPGVRMVFTITPHDPMVCPRCGTMVTANEVSCSTCYPKEGAK